jgi:hypothetical protein
MKSIWKAGCMAVALALAAGWATAREPEPELVPEEIAAPEVAPEVRQPTLRRIHTERDAETLRRIERMRERLPEQYRKRFNFAWAAVRAEGMDKNEYYAHSGIQNLDRFSSKMAAKLADISVRPTQGRYQTLCVNQHDIVDGPNCWQRTVDTEYKIVEDVVARLPDRQTKGRMKLYTDLPPCASCWNVLKQFMAEYPNMRVQVLYKKK